MIIKNASVFQEDGTFKTQDIYIEGDKIAENGSGDVLDADGLTAEVDGEEVPVTTREFNILYKLLSYPKKTFSRAQLMDEFWGVDSNASLRAVDVYITKLRDKFSACDGFTIKTVRGLGYKAVLT